MKDELLANRYRLGARLGAGGMGAVYEALDVATGRKRAVKVMHAHTLDREDLRERFRLEAKITAHVRSPFLVDVLDAGVDGDGTPYLVMELLRGEDLGRRLKRGAFSIAETLSYMTHAAYALDETHRAGIIHRDLKPANLYREERDREAPRVKVLDFGVAKVMADSTAGSATSGAGTPLYMAPEQFRGAPVGPATDIYALGMMAFSFLVGTPYWGDEREAMTDLIAFALHAVQGPKEPATARALRQDVKLPESFDAWFSRATAVEPSQRFASATEAVTSLAEVFGRDIQTTLSEWNQANVPLEAPEATPLPATATAEIDDGRTRSLDATDSAASTPATERDEPLPRGVLTATELAPPKSPDEKETVVVAPGQRRRIGTLVFAGAAAIIAAALVWGARGIPDKGRTQPSAQSSRLSPLSPADSVLACPIFEVAGVEEPAGWLGAAAAATFCERARILLGGAGTRTLVPAELLLVPAQPSDRLSEDPYAPKDSRQRTLDAAKIRAAAYADGRVTKDVSGFRVEISLKKPRGEEIARGAGNGRALYEAVRAAMGPLIAPNALPRAAALVPRFADLTRTPDVSGALALLDMSFAMFQNAGTMPEECARVEARSADYAELGPGARYWCAYTLGLPAAIPVSAPEAAAASIGATAARARTGLMMERRRDLAVAAALESALANEADPLSRSVLAATASCLLQAEAPAKAQTLALVAVQAEPRNLNGEWCRPWIQLVNVTQGTAGSEAAIRGLRAWTPWESYSWYFGAEAQKDRPSALAYARRSYALSPLDTNIAGTLADRLLSIGATEEARAVAAATSSGGYPVHRLESELILLRVDASQAHFGAALARAEKAMVVSKDDAGWVRVLRLEVAWRALGVALILGKAARIADLAVAVFLDPDPSPLDGASIDVPLRIAALCGRASPSVAKRCFARLETLRSRLSLGSIPGTDAFTEGAARYAAGDLAGAARAFRPLLREPGAFVAVMADAMIASFEHTGETDVVDRLEAAAAEAEEELNGASLKTLRAARRAAKRGDVDAAKALAQRIVGAWSVADEEVPAVAEMRKIAARR